MKILDTLREEIRLMKGYASGEQPASGKFIKLNTNENPFPPSAKVVDAIHDAASHHLNVYPDALANAFRIAAAELFKVTPENIICGNGSDDILTILTRAFVPPNSKIRIPYPSYVLYKTLADIQGAQTEEVSFNADWSLPDRFGQSDENLKLAFLPNPNSPSGTVVPADVIVDLAQSLDCPLVVDEAYADFAESNCLHLISQCDNIVVTRTLSKSYGLAGLRFGFAIAHEKLIAQLLKVKDSYNCDSLAIAGATAAIHDQQWLGENCQKIIALRTELIAHLQRLDFETIPSQANFVWCKHRSIDSKTLYEKLKQNFILVRYMDYPNWGDGLRISVGTANQISALITILETILND